MDQEILSWKVPPDPLANLALLMRVPAVAIHATARRAMRQPAGSRLRTWFLSSSLRGGWELANRGDYEALIAYYDPNARIELGEGGPIDFAGTVTPGGMVDLFRSTEEAMDLQHTVEEILDMGGPCFACHCERRVTGGSSGATFVDSIGSVYTMRDGRVAIQEMLYRERDELPAALAAASQAASVRFSR
jgi:hypothetical protein